MDFGPLLVEKSVLGVIAVERILDPARGQLAFQAIDGIGRTPVVLIGEMAQEGHPDLRGVRRLGGGNAIKANRRVQLGNLHPRDDGDGASHAESQHRGLSAAGLEVLDGPPHVLSGSPGPVQARHHMVGLVRTLGDPPPVEVRHQGAVSLPGQPVGHALDLAVEPPPLLNHHHAGRVTATGNTATGNTARGSGQIARHLLAGGTVELNVLSHDMLLFPKTGSRFAPALGGRPLPRRVDFAACLAAIFTVARPTGGGLIDEVSLIKPH